MRRALAGLLVAAAGPMLGGADVRAQAVPPRVSPPAVGAPRDTTRAAGADSAGPRPPRRPRPAGAVAPRVGTEPPISPRRAFLSSLLVPGWGQTRLDRPTAAALFIAIELTAITLARKASGDLRTARAFRADSIPTAFPIDTLTGRPPVDSTGRLLPGFPLRRGAFTNDLASARRLHLEDWLAVIAFNHLFAGAEAFVSANLWDLPAQVSAVPTAAGPALAVSLRW